MKIKWYKLRLWVRMYASYFSIGASKSRLRVQTSRSLIRVSLAVERWRKGRRKNERVGVCWMTVPVFECNWTQKASDRRFRLDFGGCWYDGQRSGEKRKKNGAVVRKSAAECMYSGLCVRWCECLWMSTVQKRMAQTNGGATSLHMFVAHAGKRDMHYGTCFGSAQKAAVCFVKWPNPMDWHWTDILTVCVCVIPLANEWTRKNVFNVKVALRIKSSQWCSRQRTD